jgi:phage gp37-like protein
MRQLEWDEAVSGIEDGIIAVLQTLSVKQGGYVKEIASYAGELDSETLRRAVSQISPRFPLFLVSYTDGEDKQIPAVASVYGEPRIWEHTCTFSVIACDNDARGDRTRRRGAGEKPGLYKLISDARRLLAGLQLFATIDEGGETHNFLLTFDPLKLDGAEYVARLPAMTAYAQHFTTRFKWCETDRRKAGVPVEEIIVTVGPLPPNAKIKFIAGAPGVFTM